MEILHNLDLYVSKAQSLCLIGPNGAGKSTILHSIYGFTNIFSGKIDIDGKEIKEYLGVVAGEAISGANFVKDFLASIKDFTGGRSGAYEEELSKARNIAFDEMNQKAREMGANGVVGIDIDYGTLGDTGSMLMVSVNGTAIKY